MRVNDEGGEGGACHFGDHAHHEVRLLHVEPPGWVGLLAGDGGSLGPGGVGEAGAGRVQGRPTREESVGGGAAAGPGQELRGNEKQLI